MQEIDGEALQGYLEECKEHLENIEMQLLDLEKNPDALDENLMNTIFRAAYSVNVDQVFLA